MAQDYNSTLNLPQTEFSMRGNLTQKEPAMLEHWAKDRTYYAMIEKNEGKPRYDLHEGPPYANGIKVSRRFVTKNIISVRS